MNLKDKIEIVNRLLFLKRDQAFYLNVQLSLATVESAFQYRLENEHFC